MARPPHSPPTPQKTEDKANKQTKNSKTLEPGDNLVMIKLQETWDPSLGWEDPLEKGMATHSSILFLLREFHGQRSLVGYSGITKSWTQLSD